MTISPMAALERQRPGTVGALRLLTPRFPGPVRNFLDDSSIPDEDFQRWVDYPAPPPHYRYPDPNSLLTLAELADRQYGWTLFDPPGLRDTFQRGQGRNPLPQRDSVTNAQIPLQRLGLGLELQHNTWTDRVEYRGQNADDRKLTPRLRVLAEALYEDRRYCPTSKTVWDAVCELAYQRTYHPVLDRLAALTWDGLDRLSRLGELAFGQEPGNELANEVAALIVRGVVVRALHPGSHFPYALILYSFEQGVAKGDALRLLALGRYIEGASFRGFDWQKRLQERTRGASIVEVGEIDSVGGSELSNLKSLITDDALDNREAYARESITRKLTAIFVGTTNKRTFLTDRDHRRTPVLEIPQGRQIDVGWLRANREQLWAQAATEYRAGRWWEPEMGQHAVRLPRHLWDAANEHSKRYELVGNLRVWLETVLGPIPWGTAVLAADLWSACTAGYGRPQSQEYSHALDDAGWEPHRWNTSGKSARAWRRKGDVPTRAASRADLAVTGWQPADLLMIGGQLWALAPPENPSLPMSTN